MMNGFKILPEGHLTWEIRRTWHCVKVLLLMWRNRNVNLLLVILLYLQRLHYVLKGCLKTSCRQNIIYFVSKLYKMSFIVWFVMK